MITDVKTEQVVINQVKYKTKDVILSVEELHKKYNEGYSNEVHVLKGMNFEIPKGQMVAIMGASGCGKTTLLNLIGGLDHITSGKISVNDNNLSHLSDKDLTEFRRDSIGYIFQLFNLFADQTLIENVSLPLILQGIPLKEAQAQALEVLDEVGIASRANEKPSNLSGGEQQKVAIARSLVTKPKLILADEPTGDLDVSTSKDIMKLFKNLQKIKPEMSIIVVTHSEAIAHYCDRIIRIDDGIIIEDDSIGNSGTINLYKDFLENEKLVTSQSYFEELTQTPILEVNQLSKSFMQGSKQIDALVDVSFNVYPGEFLIIRGPSGAGKTTLLNLIAGLDLPDTGDISFKGQNIVKMPDNKKSKLRLENFSFIFQDYGLIPHLTTEENTSLPLSIRGKKDKALILDFLSKVGIAELADQKPAYLSGGQMQRVGIARALVNNPSILFADEPTGDLDTKTSNIIMELLRSYHEEHGTTIVLVTHDPAIAKYGTREIYLRDGKKI